MTKNRSASALNAAPVTIINPRLTQKLNFSARQQGPKQSVSLQTSGVTVSPAALKKCEGNGGSGLTELEAVKALLSMKSRASSMPSQGADGEAAEAKHGRRKQVFKPPMKKPHINPSEY